MEGGADGAEADWGELVVFGLTGKTASLSIPLTMRNHASGVYLIKVMSDDGVRMCKIVVDR